MVFEWSMIKPILDALKEVLKAAKGKLDDKKYEKLLSSVRRELLKIAPDLDYARANIVTIEKSGKMTRDLLQVQRMMKQVEGHYRPKAKKAAKPIRGKAKKAAKPRAVKVKMGKVAKLTARKSAASGKAIRKRRK